jgi:hypothetical protein
MSAPYKRLLLSFWNICLDNLPEGSFYRRQLQPDEAKTLIHEAQQAKRLTCVSQDDLLAPHHERARSNHQALCGVLGEHSGIMLSLEDFCSKHDEDGDALYFTRALSLVQVTGQDSLLVITCNYMLDESTKELPRFTVALDSVTFHLIESIG